MRILHTLKLLYKFKCNIQSTYRGYIEVPLNPIWPRVFCVIMPRGSREGAHSAPCIYPDRKMLLTWNLAQSCFVICNVTKKLAEKKFQNYSYSDDDVTNYVNFLKNYAKND